jgi:hypothetical protein
MKHITHELVTVDERAGGKEEESKGDDDGCDARISESDGDDEDRRGKNDAVVEVTHV